MNNNELRWFLLPLVGIPGRVYKNYKDAIIDVGFRYKEIDYREYTLFISVKNLLIMEELERVNQNSIIHKEGDIFVIEIECIEKYKHLWELIFNGRFKEISLLDWSMFTGINPELYITMYNYISNNKNFMVNYITKELKNIEPYSKRVEIARDLAKDAEKLLDKNKLIPKMKLNLVCLKS